MKKLLITISNRNKSVAIYGDKYMKNPIENKISVAKEKLVIDLIEASMLTSESVPTLRRRIATGILNAFQSQPNGKWFINREDLDRYRGVSKN
jgi:hypothetical protein